MKKFTLTLVLALTTTAAYPHSGGTDEHGGHTDHSTGTYHFHSSASYKLPKAALSGLWNLAFGDDSEPNKRNPANRRAFHSRNPCPSTGKTSGPCPGYHVDHVVPLACGGPDSPSNMQWLTATENLMKGAQGCRY